MDCGTDFVAWMTQWESYCNLSGLADENAQKQVQALMLCFSRDTLSIVQNLGLTEEENGNVASIIRAVKRYVDGQVNETVERRYFRKRTQQVGESFDDFLVSLRELVKTCNFCSDACTSKNIRDQIIDGLLDADTTEDLLQEADLTLAKAVSKCQAQEAAKKQRAHLHNYNPEVAALRKPQDQHPRPPTSTCQAVVLQPTQPAGPSAQLTIKPALTAKKLAILQRFAEARLGTMVPLPPQPPRLTPEDYLTFATWLPLIQLH